MTGERVDPHAVVVASIEGGVMRLWRVRNPTRVSWSLDAGRTLETGSTHARLVVEGEFERIRKTGRSLALEQQIQEALILQLAEGDDHAIDADSGGRGQLPS